MYKLKFYWPIINVKILITDKELFVAVIVANWFSIYILLQNYCVFTCVVFMHDWM